jgi:hypothetical protein
MLPYILESLYNYRSVTGVWKQFFSKRAYPDVPEQKNGGQKEISKNKNLTRRMVRGNYPLLLVIIIWNNKVTYIGHGQDQSWKIHIIIFFPKLILK